MSDWDHRFSPGEYSRRVDLVRDAMGKRGIDLLLVHTPENLFYLSGYDTSGYFAYQFIALPFTGEPEILIRRGEAENARRSTIKRRSVFFDLDDVVAKTVDIVHRFPGVQRIGIKAQPRQQDGTKATEGAENQQERPAAAADHLVEWCRPPKTNFCAFAVRPKESDCSRKTSHRAKKGYQHACPGD